jgi:hypothetical protein
VQSPFGIAAEESVVLQQTGQPEQTGRVKSYWEQNMTGGINRTAYYTEGSNSWTVWEYSDQDDGTAYVVQDGRCAYYCQQTNLQCNLEDSLCSYDYLTSAKFAGTFEGQNCFVWSDNLGPVPMNVQSICINGTTPAPVSGTRYVRHWNIPVLMLCRQRSLGCRKMTPPVQFSSAAGDCYTMPTWGCLWSFHAVRLTI